MEWIKCSDRKPAEPDGEVRIITVMVSNGKSVGVCDYATGNLPSAWGEFSAYGDIDADKITHWMPMPKPPIE